MKKLQVTLVIGFLCFIAKAFSAAIYTNIYSFSPLIQTNSAGIYTNLDGASSRAGLVASGNRLYGTTSLGGTNGAGTIFRINTDGSAFANLHEFSDNGSPVANLLLAGNTLYGTTQHGGTNMAGAVFKIGTDGTGFTTLYNFTALLSTNEFGVYTNSDGANPTAGLVPAGGALYGTTSAGGINGNGTIYRINSNGTGFTTLYNFTALLSTNEFGVYTNSDGANPLADLLLAGGTLYGTAEFGGSGGSGTVFAVSTNGTSFTNLHSFSQLVNLTNGDGAFVFSGVTLSGGVLFGTTIAGGPNGNGTIFAVNTNGVNFTNLYIFSASLHFTNSDGIKPASSLVLSSNVLYGTTQFGGINSFGTVFAINTSGANFTNLYNFSTATYDGFLGTYTNSDGALPQASLLMLNNSLYGAASFAGSGGQGTVFVFSSGSIPLNIQPAINSTILTWGNPAFFLQAATNVTGIYTTIPNAFSPYTNATGLSPQVFFRLQAF